MLKAPRATRADVASDDPTDVRVLAVRYDDLLAALEANVRREAGAVLRITPPFAARMRARLHVTDAEPSYDDPAPVHVDPSALVDAPPFPHPDETGDDLRANPDATYSLERHRERHHTAVEAWREAVRRSVCDCADVETRAGPVSVEVRMLG